MPEAFKGTLKALDLSLAWLWTGFPGAFLNTKNPSLPQTFCQAEGCYLWGKTDTTTRTLQEKTSCCLVLQDHLSFPERNSNVANWKPFWGSAIPISTSCRAALGTRCHSVMRLWPELLPVQDCSLEDNWSENYIKSCFNSTWHRALLRTYINTWKWVWCNIKIGKLAWNSIAK